jgi:ATP-dependent Clp protease adaptor protein ClpS
MVREKLNPLSHQDQDSANGKELILFNDEVNSFEFVIESLIEICEHDPLQAEQCALTAHYKGKCPVKTGSFSELKPKHDELSRRGLTVAIE